MVIIKLNELLRSRGLTIYWLSQQLGISQNNLADLARGRRTSINVRYIDAICDKLNCRIEDLLEYRKSD